MIVADVLMDMAKNPVDGRHGNAKWSPEHLQACKFYELFSKTDCRKCAIVTPSSLHGNLKGRKRRRFDRKTS
jgi:hypothetical protein